MKSVSAALTFVPVIFLSSMHIFPKTHRIYFQNRQLLFDYEYLYFLNSFCAFPDLVELK